MAPSSASWEDVLCKFAAALVVAGLWYRTIKSHMAGVHYLHIEEGLGYPFLQSLPRLHYMLQGVKRSRGGEVAGREHQLITPYLLCQIKAVWDVNAADPDYIMLWAACFFAFLKAGELTIPNDSEFDASSHLAWGDIGVDNPKYPVVLSVRLKASKTDPFQKSTLYVGKGSRDICPESAVLAFLVERGAGPCPLFCFKDGWPLTRQRFISAVRDALETESRHPAILVTFFGSGRP